MGLAAERGMGQWAAGSPIETLHPTNDFTISLGHVNPAKASNLGLIYDILRDDYIPYLCGLNYVVPYP